MPQKGVNKRKKYSKVYINFPNVYSSKQFPLFSFMATDVSYTSIGVTNETIYTTKRCIQLHRIQMDPYLFLIIFLIIIFHFRKSVIIEITIYDF